MKLQESDVQKQLSRRRPGQSHLTTPRDEKDQVEIHSGTEFGTTLGTPIMMLVRNQDQRPHDYSANATDAYPRPSHADWTYLQKYGVKASSGGGRSSARETIGRVAAGAIAEKYLEEAYGIQIVAFVSSVGRVKVPSTGPVDTGGEEDDDVESPISVEYLEMLNNISRQEVDASLVRCPHEATAKKMISRIERAKAKSDSIGGTVTCVIRNVPIGLGEPCFDKMEASLGKAMLSVPSTKAFEIGSGFAGTEVSGSKHNDAFGTKVNAKGDSYLGTITNNSGGVQGGITNGENIFFRVGFKSPATIGMEQATSTYDGLKGSLAAKGRHDPCVVPRAVPIVEAMAALVVIDQLLVQLARQESRKGLPMLKNVVATAETTVGGDGAQKMKMAVEEDAAAAANNATMET